MDRVSMALAGLLCLAATDASSQTFDERERSIGETVAAARKIQQDFKGQNKLCIPFSMGGSGSYDRLMEGLPRFVDVDLRYLAIVSGFVDEKAGDRFIPSGCGNGALPNQHLPQGDRAHLAENHDQLLNPDTKYHAHNNLFMEDAYLYHLIYFPHELYYPASAYSAGTDIEGAAGLAALNVRAASAWERLRSVCSRGDSALARRRYLFGQKLCGDFGDRMHAELKGLHLDVKAWVASDGAAETLANPHPLLVQVLVERLAGLHDWRAGPMSFARVPETNARQMEKIAATLGASVTRCEQLGIWPLYARAVVVGVEKFAGMVRGVSDPSALYSASTRFSQRSAVLCGPYSALMPGNALSALSQEGFLELVLIQETYR